MQLYDVMVELKSMGDSEATAGMARYGIKSDRALGISIPRLQALAWLLRPEEFVKRAGFVLMAVMAVHNRNAADRQFDPFFDRIQEEAADDRNFVKKAVNWALRQIGKRNLSLNSKAMIVAEKIKRSESSATRWVANDALRELRNEKIQQRLSRKATR